MSTAFRESAKRGVSLQYLTIAYNVMEAGIAIAAGSLASSVSLVSFGLDSLIEVAASLLALGRLRDRVSERTAQRGVALSLLALAVWTGYESLERVMAGEVSERSLAGLLIALASVFVMPWLAREKKKVAVELGSAALAGEAKQTDFCFYLSLILLGGMAAQWLFGWNQVDAVAALLMTPVLLAEARRAWRGESCCGGGACH
jgi:divalent metal cation (Fe/Co/Zn/Cd) transporter